MILEYIYNNIINHKIFTGEDTICAYLSINDFNTLQNEIQPRTNQCKSLYINGVDVFPHESTTSCSCLVTSSKSQIIHWSVPTETIKTASCECGSDKLGFSKHSTWCPKYA